MKNFMKFYPATDAGGGAAPDGAQKPVPEGTPTPEQKPTPEGKDWKAEADRKEALLVETQRKLKAFTDAQEEEKRKLLEKQGKFEELKKLLEAEKEQLQKKVSDLEAFQKQVMDAKTAELAELIKDLPDDQKALIELGKDIDAQIRLAKTFAAAPAQPPGSFGPNVPPGQYKTVSVGIQYPTMKG